MSSPSRSGALDHLAASEISALIIRYYDGEAIATLLAEFRIDCRTGDLWRLLPPSPTNRACPACGAMLVEQFRGRTTGAQSRSTFVRCSGCKHIDAYDCGCGYCQTRSEELRQLAEERRRKAIAEFCKQTWDYSEHAIAPTDLSARAALSLLCIVRSGAWLQALVFVDWPSSDN